MTDFGTNKKPFTIKEISVHRDLIELPHINEWEQRRDKTKKILYLSFCSG